MGGVLESDNLEIVGAQFSVWLCASNDIFCHLRNIVFHSLHKNATPCLAGLNFWSPLISLWQDFTVLEK